MVEKQPFARPASNEGRAYRALHCRECSAGPSSKSNKSEQVQMCARGKNSPATRTSSLSVASNALPCGRLPR